MENLFDHAPTATELEDLVGTSSITREIHESLHLSADTENGYLARLFMMRGDDATAGKFLERIPDAGYRRDVVLVDTFH